MVLQFYFSSLYYKHMPYSAEIKELKRMLRIKSKYCSQAYFLSIIFLNLNWYLVFSVIYFSYGRFKFKVQKRETIYIHFFPEVILTTSRYGKPVLQLGEYRFNKYCRSKGPKARWVCTQTSMGCRAIVVTIDDTIVDKKNEHNHRKKAD